MVEVASSKPVDQLKSKGAAASLEKISQEELLELKNDLLQKVDKCEYVSVAKIVRVLSRKRITRDLLKDTLIGKTISSLTKLSCPPSRKDLDGEVQEIKTLATDLVELWRKASENEKKQGSNGGPAKTDDSKLISAASPLPSLTTVSSNISEPKATSSGNK